MKAFTLAAIALGMTLPGLWAKKTQSQRTEALGPAQQAKTFKLPEGYVIELVASEADGVINPIDMAFDDAGRLWTQTAQMYPLDPGKDIGWSALLKLMADPEAQKKNPELHQEFTRIQDLYQGKTKGEDKILILSNLYNAGETKTQVFADGLTIPQSILPYKNGAFVAQGSETFFLDDTDGDGVADHREPILTGFGYTDSHTMSHTLVRGPGNWIHFSQGALNMGEVTAVKSGAQARFDYSKIGRFSIDGQKLEVVSSGLNNIWGFWMRPDGQWWGTEANDQGWSVTPLEPGSGFRGIGNETIRPYQPLFPRLHSFRVGGTGISGLAYSDDLEGGFPAEWKNVAFLANPITNTINAVRIVRNTDGSVTAEHLPDFLSCEDDWFRPVNIEFGPDGCLYIADWYNKIVSHNEVPRSDPTRDKEHGRIWRIRYEGAPKREIPDVSRPDADLIAHLKSPIAWEKRAAMNQIIDGNHQDLAQDLKQLAKDSTAHSYTRIHALWSLEGLGRFDLILMARLLISEDDNLRREAVRAMAQLCPTLDTFNAAMAGTIDDPNPMIRSATLRAIAERGEANADTIDILISACLPETAGDHMGGREDSLLGGPYERKFERYLARMALEKFPDQLASYLESPMASEQPIRHLLWASQALPQVERDEVFVKIWRHKDASKLMDEATFVILASALHLEVAQDIAKPLLADPTHGPRYVQYTLDKLSQIQSPQLTALLVPALESMLADDEQRMAALEAIAQLKAAVKPELLTSLLKTRDPVLAKAALKALQADPKRHQAAIASVASDSSVSMQSRLSAVHSLLQVAPEQGKEQLSLILPMLRAENSQLLAQELSGSKPGAAQLLSLWSEQSLGLGAFDVSSAERIVSFKPKDKQAAQLLKQVRNREQATKQQLAKRIEHLIQVSEKIEGDPKAGETLFNTCLLCHKVGERGHDIAPALDGSAHRDKEALLTAILDPDAAAESGYLLFRVRKKDGTLLEGYRFKDDKSGVTLAFMGGAKVFTPAAEIASKEFVGKRSFMPSGLIDGYSDQQVADFLAYIATLK